MSNNTNYHTEVPKPVDQQRSIVIYGLYWGVGNVRTTPSRDACINSRNACTESYYAFSVRQIILFIPPFLTDHCYFAVAIGTHKGSLIPCVPATVGEFALLQDYLFSLVPTFYCCGSGLVLIIRQLEANP